MESINIFPELTARYPQVVHMGPYSLKKLSQEVLELGGTKVLVVTDKGIIDAGIAEKAILELNKIGLKADMFSDIEANPSLQTVNDCAVFAREKNIDLIVGLGGGSSLDVAKLAAVLVINPGNISDYIGLHKIRRPGLPKILIPTTAGSGSEASQAVVLRDEDGSKKAAYSRYLMAETVILDPTLTISLPQKVTMDGGFDALVTAIESYTSLTASPATDIAALKAIELIVPNIRNVSTCGSNLDARYQMLLGSFFAGMATLAGLGGIHALAYPLESKFHLTHGLANAIMAPYVMEYNRISSITKYSAIAKAMGEKVDNLTAIESSKLAITCFREIMEDLKVPTKMRDFGIPKNEIPDMAENAIKYGSRLLATNPRTLSVEAATEIYSMAW